MIEPFTKRTGGMAHTSLLTTGACPSGKKRWRHLRRCVVRRVSPAPQWRLRGCLKSLHGFLQRYPHAIVIVDFRELRTIVTSSEAALHQLKTLMSGLFKQPLRAPPPLTARGVPGAAVVRRR